MVSMPQNNRRRRSLNLHAPAMDFHCDRDMMFDSASECRLAANRASKLSNSMEKPSGIYSAQLQSLKLARTISSSQEETGILARLALKILKFLFGPNLRHEECVTMNCALLEEAQRVVRERDDLSLRLSTLQCELEEKSRELLEMQAETLRFKKQADNFREIFLAEAGNQKISDDDVIQSFVKMRQKALALAKSKALRFDGKPKFKRNASQCLKDWYGDGWNSWKPKDRELRLREGIFEILHHFILNTACFGVEGLPVAITHPGKPGHIAQGLTDLEAMAAMAKLSPGCLVNWRVATIEFIEALGVQERRSEQVAERLLSWLHPILDDKSKSLTEGLQSLTLDLCKDAFNFTIMMRKSRDEYRCETISTADIESWAEAHAVDQGKNCDAGDNIAYVLFGALTKKSMCGGVERVLVKAEVVMERKASP